jgi:CDP-diacylglycerol--glycerol-3-phosphate 3-phosphatidyltransferase
MNLPNQITFGRLIIAILFFILLSQYGPSSPQKWILDVCLVLCVVAGISDLVDGYLARKRNETTSLGRIVDPFVDKVLTCGAFAFFSGASFVESGENVTEVAPWMVVLIFGRELLVTAVRSVSESRGDPFGANWWGKIKMGWQTVCIWYVFVYVGHLPRDGLSKGLLYFAVYGAVAVTALSMAAYLRRAKGLLAMEE